jgi:hypothetical protein
MASMQITQAIPVQKARDYDTKLGWSKLDAVLPYKVVIFAR